MRCSVMWSHDTEAADELGIMDDLGYEINEYEYKCDTALTW